MFLTLLLLPFIAAFSTGLLGRSIGIKGSYFITLTLLFISSFLSIVLGYEVILSGSPVSLRLGCWVDTGLLSMDWGFALDPLSAWLASTVLIISFLVHIFATSYMASDPAPQRFMCLLTAFTGSMILLVTGDSLGILFLGWELIGITSFLLIGYWWDRSFACNAASQALIVNRIGDCSFTLALILTITMVGSLDLESIILFITNTFSLDSAIETIQENNMALMLTKWTGIFIVIAAFGKSAQFLLHTWLPLSMEGPTPVSALLHAATLVAGGTYLLLRCSAIVSASTAALLIAALIGSITAILAASTALFQSDQKRIIAYSTMSQFGYLTASIGLGQTGSTLFHLSSHSGFKALLFITAGGVIHSAADEQDIKKLGGLISSLPFTYVGMFIGSMSLIATPYLSGFFSKDLILELAISQWSLPSTWMWILGSFVAGLTACYSTRLIAYIYLGKASGPKKTYEMCHEQPLGIIVPIVVLSLLAISFGYYGKDASTGLGIFNEAGVISPYEVPLIVHADFGLSLLTKTLPLMCTIIGILLGIFYFVLQAGINHYFIINQLQKEASVFTDRMVNENQNTSTKSITYIISSVKSLLPLVKESLVKGLTNKWWIDGLYAKIFTWPAFSFALIGAKLIDRGILELIGPNGLTVLFLGDYTKNKEETITMASQEPSSDLVTSNSSTATSNWLQLLAKEEKQEKEGLLVSSKWLGYSIPDYGSYVVLFALFIIFSILMYTLNEQGIIQTFNMVSYNLTEMNLNLLLAFIVLASIFML